MLESTTRWPRADRPLRVALPAQLESVPLARHALARWLAGNGACADAIFALSVALGEACTNAVEHAQRARPQAVLVRAERKGRTVRILVRDYGRWDYSPSIDERGRGLQLMRGLMDCVQIRRTPRGSTLVMSHPLDRQPEAASFSE